MSLTIDDVAKVAVLARLRLSPDELSKFTGQLNSIVDYVDQLKNSIRRKWSRWRMESKSATSFATTFAARHCRRGPAKYVPPRNQESFLVPAVLE